MWVLPATFSLVFRWDCFPNAFMEGLSHANVVSILLVKNRDSLNKLALGLGMYFKRHFLSMSKMSRGFSRKWVSRTC